MNKFYNVLLLTIFFPTMVLSIIVGNDVPLPFLHTSGGQLPFHRELLFVLGVIILFVNIRRSIRRWMGLKLVNQTEKYAWNTEVSKERVQRIYVYNFLEALIFTCAGYGLYSLTNASFLPMVGFFFGALDGLVFVLFGANAKKFRVGMTTKALLAADRDVNVIYFKGLRQIQYQQQTLFFDFKEGLQLRLPVDLIPREKQQEFFKHLLENVDGDKVYFSNNILEIIKKG